MEVICPLITERRLDEAAGRQVINWFINCGHLRCYVGRSWRGWGRWVGGELQWVERKLCRPASHLLRRRRKLSPEVVLANRKLGRLRQETIARLEQSASVLKRQLMEDLRDARSFSADLPPQLPARSPVLFLATRSAPLEADS